MEINKNIFRDNDVRGLYPTELDEGVMYKLGQAVAVWSKAKVVGLGRDMRESSPNLQAALTDGFLSMGLDVVDYEMITTPMMSFAAATDGVDLAGIVSSSHNPKNFNGLILADKKGAMNEDGWKEIMGLVLGEVKTMASSEGSVRRKSIMAAWIAHVLSLVDVDKIGELKVVLDAGNSVAGLELKPCFERLKKVKTVEMYFKPDGSFPNHIPNPLLKSTLRDIRSKVVDEKADLGLAYDGDSDRVFLIDERGEAINGSMLTAFLAKNLILASKKKEPICLYTRVMSRIVPETIEKYGGRAHVVHVGHSFIKEKMREEKALFAGEHSGHFYFEDNFYNDSALVASVKLLEMISKSGKKVSELMSEFEKYEKVDEVSLAVDDRDEFVEKMVKLYSGKSMKMERPDKITSRDGVTFDFDDYWFNLRPSGTEPVVRLNLESLVKGKAEERLGEVETNARKLGAEVVKD